MGSGNYKGPLLIFSDLAGVVGKNHSVSKDTSLFDGWWVRLYSEFIDAIKKLIIVSGGFHNDLSSAWSERVPSQGFLFIYGAPTIYHLPRIHNSGRAFQDEYSYLPGLLL